MKTVSVSGLKARLSKYLREVRRGGEVQILDRGRPVSRLTGIAAAAGAADQEHRRALVRAGVLRPSSRDPVRLVDEPLLELPVDLCVTVAEERADRP